MPEPDPTLQPDEAARAAGLRYVTLGLPGIRRRRHGKGFVYVGSDGRPLRDPALLARVRALAVPPAWTAVWICPDPDGHIQAVGRDARQRKQYRYHARWREQRDGTKFHRLAAFGRVLPRIRARVAQDLHLSGLPRAKVLATVARLLDVTRIRVGNPEYSRHNDSFGLTTLHDEHVDVHGATLRFHFRGKGGKEHEVEVRDRRLAHIVRQCQEIPGQELFQYVDEHGARHTVGSGDVNAWLREASGADFTAKDFRTWSGTVCAVAALRTVAVPEAAAHQKKALVAVVQQVAAELGNTPAVCRRAYIDPRVFAAWQSGRLMALAATEPDAEQLTLRLLAEADAAVEPTLEEALAGSLVEDPAQAKSGRARKRVASRTATAAATVAPTAAETQAGRLAGAARGGTMAAIGPPWSDFRGSHAPWPRREKRAWKSASSATGPTPSTGPCSPASTRKTRTRSRAR